MRLSRHQNAMRNATREEGPFLLRLTEWLFFREFVCDFFAVDGLNIVAGLVVGDEALSHIGGMFGESAQAKWRRAESTPIELTKDIVQYSLCRGGS